MRTDAAAPRSEVELPLLDRGEECVPLLPVQRQQPGCARLCSWSGRVPADQPTEGVAVWEIMCSQEQLNLPPAGGGCRG